MTIEEKRKKISENLEKTEDEANYDDLFLAVKQEVDAFNFFLGSENVDRANANILGAVKSAIQFLLLQPIVKLDKDLFAFNLKKVRTAGDLVKCLKIHLLLFYEFDSKGVPQNRWAIHSMTEEKVQIMLKMNPGIQKENGKITMNVEESQKILNAIKASTESARINGWTGMLEILTMSDKKTILPI